MRDLAARLRAIVRENRREPVRELIREPIIEYGEDAGMAVTPGPDRQEALDAIAAVLGGTFVAPAPDQERPAHSACLVIDHDYDGTRHHGRRRVDTCRVSPEAPLALFEPRLAAVPGWASRIVFFDIETTGLSGGAGTIAFLVGCGWFEAGGFRVRQWRWSWPGG